MHSLNGFLVWYPLESTIEHLVIGHSSLSEMKLLVSTYESEADDGVSSRYTAFPVVWDIKFICSSYIPGPHGGLITSSVYSLVKYYEPSTVSYTRKNIYFPVTVFAVGAIFHSVLKSEFSHDVVGTISSYGCSLAGIVPYSLTIILFS